MLIQGDNLEALKALLPFYAGRVKCIYIDPPYNTRSAFEHYDDNLEHSLWLAMMWPRLELLRELLSEDGSIWVSIDDNEGHYLKVIMDEVFGRSNRLNIVAVKMSEASGVKMAHVESRLPKLKEYVVGYRKPGFRGLDIDLVEAASWNEEYKTVLTGLSEEDVSHLRTLRDSDPITDDHIDEANSILAKASLVSASKFMKERGLDRKSYEDFRSKNPWMIVQAVGSSSVLALAKKDRDRNQDVAAVRSSTGLMYFYKTEFDRESRQPRVQIIFADESLFQNPGDFWQDIKTTGGVGQEGGVLFPNGKKPEKLIWRIINMASHPGDIVLDSFLGSGTTAAVAHKMGRRYIGIEVGKHALTHCVPRLRKVIEGEQGGVSKLVDWSGGGGYRFYRLGEAVFDEDGALSPGIAFEPLAAHVWFAESGQAPTSPPHGPVLGIDGERAIALLYNGVLGDKRPDGGNVLTRQTLSLIRDHLPPNFEGEIVVYGERSALSEPSLIRERIVFRQTPYDVKARR